MPFPSKTALVTGATSGIGHALTQRLIANGTFVIAVGRRSDRLSALVAAHGADKVAAEPYDVTDLDGMAAWVAKYVPSRPLPPPLPLPHLPENNYLSYELTNPRRTKTYPTLDTIILNAGLQRSLDFTSPSSISLPSVSSELTTNYLSPLHMITHFLPHLQSLTNTQAHIILISSGLALVPIPRCPNYCATKSALHSLAWTLRAQLEGHSGSSHIRVVEVVPPAVQTELHSQQPDLVAAGQANFGTPLDEFTEEAWAALEAGEHDEIVVGPAKNFAPVEVERRKAFEKLAAYFRDGAKA
ncbi:short chain dehydrogenase [Colletotrichum sojae]|uniref:Short chain dehydrogenase n=1 Tax=Colletotrichum sojae TaxID=2175907 RepID=A0A8H6JNR6_9PEZI|nr:short chain dehydrogenase [Colletotrichum sojae]